MSKSNAREVCILSIIFKNPKTGLYESVVECGSRNCFENSIKALEAKKVEIIFKHCESESELFELGLSLHAAFISADFLTAVSAAKINKELKEANDRRKTQNIIALPRKISYSYGPNTHSALAEVLL